MAPGGYRRLSCARSRIACERAIRIRGDGRPSCCRALRPRRNTGRDWEDVGRHNAVDEVIGGQLLMERLPLAERILMVSGRTSFEIVQEAVVARIPMLASVS